MAKVFIITVTTTAERLNSTYTHIEGVYKSLDSARQRIEEIRDGYRDDDDIMILGEHWSLGEFPYYKVECVEKYYILMGHKDREEWIEYEVKGYEMEE